MFEFTDSILYFIIYLYFNIWIFTNYRGDTLRYFSIILQFIVIFNIITNLDISIFNHFVYDLLILIILWLISVTEIEKIRG
jgi:hypothetical protein